MGWHSVSRASKEGLSQWAIALPVQSAYVGGGREGNTFIRPPAHLAGGAHVDEGPGASAGLHRLDHKRLLGHDERHVLAIHLPTFGGGGGVRGPRAEAAGRMKNGVGCCPQCSVLCVLRGLAAA